MTQMHTTTWRDIDVSAYVDGELDPAALAAFETALDQDRVLQQKVKEMREVVALVKAIPLREPPRNYLLTPSMVAEQKPRQVQRRPMPLLFMRLATSLAAIVFVVTAGLTYMRHGISPVMLTQAPKAAPEMLVMEAPQDVAATVEVEAEVMLAAEPEALPEPAARVEAEKVVEVEKVVEEEAPPAALAPVLPAATPHPDGNGEAEAMLNVQELAEPTPQEEAVALESVETAEAQAAKEAESARALEDSAGTFSATGEGESMAYDAAEPTVADQYETTAVEPLRASSWWLPAVLGALTLLLGGITYWMSRRR
jgi:hypothetical protein